MQENEATGPPQEAEENLPDGVFACPNCGELLQGVSFPDEKTEKELEKTKEELLRLHAEFDNYRKRLNKRKDEELKFASEKLVGDLVVILDSLGIAANDIDYEGPLSDGLRLIHTSFLEVLHEHDIVRVGMVGEPFDPTKHEAIDTRPASRDFPPGTVLIVHRAGYFIYDRCIRPAQVVVTK